MITWILIGVVAYFAVGLFTGIDYLISRGRYMRDFLLINVTEDHFDADDKLLAIFIMLIWPIVWVTIAVIKIISAIVRHIVIPAVNKKKTKKFAIDKCDKKPEQKHGYEPTAEELAKMDMTLEEWRAQNLDNIYTPKTMEE